MLPQSSTATKRRIETAPMPLSMSTTAMYDPNGNVRVRQVVVIDSLKAGFHPLRMVRVAAMRSPGSSWIGQASP